MKLPFRKKTKELNEAAETFLFSDAVDYRVYQLSKVEKTGALVIGLLVGVVCGHIFFGSILMDIFTGCLAGISMIPVYRNHQKEKRSIELSRQFKDMLENLAASISAGVNVPDSIKSAYLSMQNQYDENAYIVKELQNIMIGFNNNINIETMLMDFGYRSGNEDIISFANTFETSYRKGGNMKEIIKNTYEILNDKITIEMEVKTMIAASKNELNIMMCMPVIFSLVLNMMGGDVTGHSTIIGRVATGSAVVIFIIAYMVGRKLMDIKL